MQHKKARDLNGFETRMDACDEIASYFASQAITQAQGRLQSGNIPVIDYLQRKNALPYVDKEKL